MMSKINMVIVVVSIFFTLFGYHATASNMLPRLRCNYELATSDVGMARVKIFNKKLKLKIRNARPNTLYTVWVDFRNRTTGELSSDYPLDKGALERGVAPAFASKSGVTMGMGIDRNGVVTNRKGNATFSVFLDYLLLKSGDSPVVGAELAMQGENRIGGYWLRMYPIDPLVEASLQETDPETGLPLLERATAQGLTIVRHPDLVTHGHTPGVKDVDHFSGFNGDFPTDCLP